MPIFKAGDPQVVFKKRDGSLFKKTFHGRSQASKAIRAWRNKGGRIHSTGLLPPKHDDVWKILTKRAKRKVSMGKVPLHVYETGYYS